MQAFSPIQNFINYCEGQLPSEIASASAAAIVNASESVQLSVPQEVYLLERRIDRVFQHLKCLSARTDNKVHFIIRDNGQFVVYTDYKLFKNNAPLYGGSPLNVLLPYRSMEIRVTETTIELLNYTVKQIINTDNKSFVGIMQDNNINASVSYEGSVIVAYYNTTTNKWVYRTTGRIKSDDEVTDDRNTLFSQFKIACGQTKLDDLRALYPNNYFVFVLTNHSQRYLCDYSKMFNGQTAILISVRDNVTNNDVPFQQQIFQNSTIVDVNTVNESFATPENNFFSNTHLDLQGYVLTDLHGNVFRTFTRAYHAGTLRVPNNTNTFLGALQAYLCGSLPTYLNFRDSTANFNEYKTACSDVANGLKELVKFLFLKFTTIQFNRQSNGTFSKSFTKINPEEYAALFNDYKDGKANFKKVLSSVQSFSIKNKQNLFIDFKNFDFDTYSFIRALAKDIDFELIVSMLYNYQGFSSHLNSIFGNVFVNPMEQQLTAAINKYLTPPVQVPVDVAAAQVEDQPED